jgi:hypothetical protein
MSSAAVRQKLVQSTNVNGGGSPELKGISTAAVFYLLVTAYII